MSSVIYVSFKAVSPLLAFMVIGYFLGKKALSKSTVEELNALVFNFLLPINIGVAIYKADLKTDLNPKMIICGTLAVVVAFLIAWLVSAVTEKDRKVIPTMVQGIFKSNYTIAGIPITLCIYGRLGIMAVLVPFVTIMNNILAVFIFEHYRSETKNTGFMLVNMAKNPLVIGSVVGLILNVVGFSCPEVLLEDVLQVLSDATTPIAMIALGAGFHFSAIKRSIKPLSVVLAMRLVILPVIIIGAAYLLGFRGLDLGVFALISATPNAVNSYSTAVMMDGDADLADEIVVLTSLFGILSMFVVFCVIGMTAGF